MSARSIVMMLTLVSVGTAHAFDSYEHNEIGDAAFQSAIAILDSAAPGSSIRLLGLPHLSSDNASHSSISIDAVANGKAVTNSKGEVERFSFGDLVAIYADYAESFNEVNSPAFGHRAAALKQIARGASYLDFPSEKNRMRSILVDNVTHFSLRAAQTYVQWHTKALLLARNKDLLWKALHYEALALHSFTDLFAVGHMLDSRETIDRLFQWTSRNNPNPLPSLAQIVGSVSGAEANFYHNAFNWKGATLENLAGNTWRGFGDGRYRIADPSCAAKSYAGRRSCSDARTKKQREIIVRAATISLLDVLNVASGVPRSFGREHMAMCYIPVYYRDTHAPIAPIFQILEITNVALVMEQLGRPIQDYGFDFSLGILRYERWEVKGSVEYIDYIRQYCKR